MERYTFGYGNTLEKSMGHAFFMQLNNIMGYEDIPDHWLSKFTVGHGTVFLCVLED